MAEIKRSNLKKRFHQSVRRLVMLLPRNLRFSFYRQLAQCDPHPDSRLELKIAQTKEELEACFSILHDAYVANGFMKPDPSGLRVTIYHALPTTTTLCAKFDGEVVGTISMIREGVFGFPLQSAFDLVEVRSAAGNIAEISSLAVHPKFRETGGAILFPLMKFMYEYCTKYFDTRHLVIAVNPDRIEMYESLLFFQRMKSAPVDNYDFANGAPAVGASLDLRGVTAIFRRYYGRKPARKNLHDYFAKVVLPNISLPRRKYFITNDPVMAPDLLDYFFNQRTKVFESLDDRKRALLWSIYEQAEYRRVLPMLKSQVVSSHPLRRHQRFSLRCPAMVSFAEPGGERHYVLTVIEVSLSGFQAESSLPLPLSVEGAAQFELGASEKSCAKVTALRYRTVGDQSYYSFKLADADETWRRCVGALETGLVSEDLH